MPMLNLIECSDNYSKTSASLWQYQRDKTAINDNGVIVDFSSDNTDTDFSSDNNTDSFNFKVKITGQTDDNGTKIMVSLKYLNNFWRNLEMPLVNCEINLILNWSANCVIDSTDSNWNKYQSKVTIQTQNQYID